MCFFDFANLSKFLAGELKGEQARVPVEMLAGHVPLLPWTRHEGM